jgi:hypothetical protein
MCRVSVFVSRDGRVSLLKKISLVRLFYNGGTAKRIFLNDAGERAAGCDSPVANMAEDRA